jgi:orotidine-5'-phosphate decarboxylase
LWPMTNAPHAADTLNQAIARVHSPVCVGLDPVLEQLPPEIKARHHEPLAAIAEFCRGVLHAVAGTVPAVKVQSACFERYGGRGVILMEEICELAAALGLVVVWDSKRGDIGISAAHYAAAARRLHASFITVSGYLGPSGIVPFLEAGLGAFVLVRTSNPDSDAVQSHTLTDGRRVAELMADTVATLGKSRIGESGLSDVGAVVGATKATDGAALRARMPDQIFLIPGYGAQGGTAADIRAMLRPDRRGVLVTSSRAIIYAPGEPGKPWTDAVSAAARRLAAEIAQVVA